MAEASSPSPTATPKRKRDDLITEMRLADSPTPHRFAKTVFSFQPPNLLPSNRSDNLPEDGNTSPRSKIAQKFSDLTIEGNGDLEILDAAATTITTSTTTTTTPTTTGNGPKSGGGAPAGAGNLGWIDQKLFAPEMCRFDFDAGTNTTTVDQDMQLDTEDDSTIARKRTKLFDLNASSSEPASDSLAAKSTIFTSQALPLDHRTNNNHLSVSVDPEITSALNFGGLQRSYPSINRLTDTKSRNRRRAGTPLPTTKRKIIAQSVKEEEEEEPVIVDPVRAALTWREDEITVYDPDDKDDDGTGLNGIGFRPTPAGAYRRAQKRRQQLAEYKKREESEARARRNQRRREQPSGGVDKARKHSIVRVRFSEAPPTTVMTT
jgi:hypothetical protein